MAKKVKVLALVAIIAVAITSITLELRRHNRQMDDAIEEHKVIVDTLKQMRADNPEGDEAKHGTEE